MKIIGGSASKNIAEGLSKKLNTSLIETDHKFFPDGEQYVRILEDIKDEHIAIVQTTYPDEKIVEFFLLQDAVKRAGAKKTTVVIPYYGYARQDQKFESGEPISAEALAKLISLNADTVVTVDPHKEYILDFFDCSAYSCTAIPAIAEYLKDKNIDLVLAPDKGAIKRAKKTSEIIDCEYDYMEKTRIDGSTVEIKPKNLDAKNQNVAIIDDIISTGGTMSKSINQLKKHNAKKVYAACTHGLFADNAVEKLESMGCDEVICTDSIENEFNKVDLSSCLSRKMEGIIKK
ncbi:MAG: ribose-phosphate diphosphokinase [Candidatus Thermoplasmatota archaeon]